ADRDVHQAVLAGERHRGLAALLRQGGEAGAPAAAHNHGQNAFLEAHGEYLAPALPLRHFSPTPFSRMCGGGVNSQMFSSSCCSSAPPVDEKQIVAMLVD